ncbi:hypothetical protein LIER_07353 [Lithospermum erythrorhizon]|uniref:Uncharacterized protein n=1 Tax=Lithospermum erythrorhizon TaxID=34254 RepID=A0AAV3P8Q8_LITER
MFQIFCECAELNPGPIDDNLDDEGEHNWVFSADQIEIENGAVDEFDGIRQNPVNAIGSNGNHDLAQRVLQLQINDQRFEDAEEELENSDTVNRD